MSAKFAPGQKVYFTTYNPQEVWPEVVYPFKRGDLLEIAPRQSGVGKDALIVKRLSDGVTDLVWPEEIKKV